MFGFCALNKTFRTAAVGVLLSLSVFISSQAVAQAQKATVINDEVMIYQDANFDSAVIGSVPKGKVFDVSKAKKNSFHKIRLRPGTVGWIIDSDIRPGVHKVAATAPKERPKKKKRRRPFDLESYRGPAIEMVQFQEETLGGRKKESLLFYGFKFAGGDTMFDGDIVTDATLMFHFGAPAYYKDATKNDAKGWLFIGNFLLQTVQLQSPNVISFFGFGPTFRYSHFDVALTNQGKQLNYSADDMTLGAVFNLGLGVKISDYALRSDVRYYWEKSSYLSVGASFLKSF